MVITIILIYNMDLRKNGQRRKSKVEMEGETKEWVGGREESCRKMQLTTVLFPSHSIFILFSCRYCLGFKYGNLKTK